MILKLFGRFSYIDKYNRLIFVYDDETTYNKLKNHCKNKVIARCGEYIVHLPKGYTGSTDDIKSMVGLDCVVNVKIINYNFISKAEKNTGERITGCKLVLENLQIAQ